MNRIWSWFGERLFVSASSAQPAARPVARPIIKMDTPQMFTIRDVEALRFA